MKKIYILFSFISLIALFSCKDDDLDIDSLVDFPPGILSMDPKDTGSKVLGGFDIKVVFVDGTVSPLASSTLILKDKDGNEITSANKQLSGIKDSLVVAGNEFDASSLLEGTYTLEVEVVDTKGQATTVNATFDIVNSLYTSNQKEMYIAGAFNGWGADPLELVANNTWEIKEIDLQGEPWKLKNTTDWTDQDWGDSNCDGVMEITTGGGPDTNCGYSGLVNLRFNDETLEYIVMPSVQYEVNLSALYLLGTVNNFQGEEYKFSLVGDNSWELGEVRLKAGDSFRFSEGPYFMGVNFGDNEYDGIADQHGTNITLPVDFQDAFYKISFNDETLEYVLELVRYPFPDNLYLVGGSTVAGWEPANSVQFVETGDGMFEIYTYLTVAGDGFKFLEVKDWAGDWGKGEEGKLLQEEELNFTVEADGFYRIIADFPNGTYSIQAMDWAVLGDATAIGWDPDTDMAFNGGLGDYTWTLTTDLVAGEIKFRANDNWDVNLGDDGADGSLNYGGANIVVSEAGNYTIELILDPSAPYTYNLTKNL